MKMLNPTGTVASVVLAAAAGERRLLSLWDEVGLCGSSGSGVLGEVCAEVGLCEFDEVGRLSDDVAVKGNCPGMGTDVWGSDNGVLAWI